MPSKQNIPCIILSTEILRQFMCYTCVTCAYYVCDVHYGPDEKFSEKLSARFSLPVLSIAVKLSGKNKLNQFTDL